jgi:dipeptidyl aminopeptidase/acylaminoacyl peptidase
MGTSPETLTTTIMRQRHTIAAPCQDFAAFRCLQTIASVVALVVIACTASAQNESMTPGKYIETIGVPPIPASLARELNPYTSIYGLPLAGWDPGKREIWLKGLSSVAWISRVGSPGATPETSSIYIRSGGIYDLYFQPQGKYLAYTKDDNGNEVFQLYLYEISQARSKLLSDGKSRNTEPVWSNAGDRIVYSSSPAGTAGVNLRILNPLDLQTDRLLAQSYGSYFKAYDWSPDDKQVVFCDFSSNTASTLWLIEVGSGDKTRLSPKADQPELYDYPQFSKDGKGLYVVTDHDSDVRRIAYIDLASRKFSYFTSNLKWDVDEFQAAPNGKTLAYVTNEDGISRLRVLDLATGKERLTAQLPVGIISDLKWNRNSTDLAFNFKSPQTPNDVYSLNIETDKPELWAKSITNRVDTEKFSVPELIHWSSFDKRTISGFVYRPPAKFRGKRPVIIDIHGGPEEQYRPAFGYEHNYFLDELGVAKIYPNVRGSTGFGKAFTALDNGVRREDAVKDIGSLLDWIRTQPDLDSSRVAIQGASYGGYLALSVATRYSDRVRGVVSESGISNLASFIERTEGWRRDLQRSEFGDERDPKIREFLERVAPLNNAQKIKKPLLIIQGQNDPRVPVSEAARLVAATKERIPVWYILAKDEGHGFVQRNNRDYRTYATILFVKEFLLK